MTAQGTRVTVDGLRRLRRDLRQVEGGMGDLKDANAKAGGIVATEAGRRAPRRGGRLGGSGRAGRAAGRATVSFGGAAVPYAGVIHYGWPARSIAAQPFVLDAAAATEHVWLPAYEADLQQLVDTVRGTY